MATMTYAGGSSGRVEQVIMRRVPLAALVALVSGVAANAALFLIGRATGAIGERVEVSNGQVLGLAAVISMTVLPTLLGTILYVILGAIGRIRRPVTVFRILALGVLLLSFLSPFTLAGASAGLILFLELMHIAAAAAIVWPLTTLAGRREP